MIKSVSDGSAFQIGHQYLMENRVRIVGADEAQITSAVIGNSGLYEQTIRSEGRALDFKVLLHAPGGASLPPLHRGVA